MQQVRAYLQLVRLPAVFTAMADVFLGFLLTHLSLSPVVDFLWLLGASTGMYLGGMVLNDVFDSEIDARERPKRPIPSGRISLRVATGLGIGLIVAGFGCAAAAGWPTTKIAAILAATILAYDWLLKSTPLGPVAMGCCRSLNIMLGASATFFVWGRPQILVALAMGIYVAGVTWFARQEATTSKRFQLIGATLVIDLGLAGLVTVMLTWPGEGDLTRSIAALAFFAAIIHFRSVLAIRDLAPATVQTAVKTMLLTIVMLDATMVYFKTGDPTLAGATALLVIPAATLGRWIFIT